MPSGRNPDHMTAQERRREIAGILAVGVLCAVRQSRRCGNGYSNDLPDSHDSLLELGANSSLSVALRPAGCQPGARERGAVRTRAEGLKANGIRGPLRRPAA